VATKPQDFEEKKIRGKRIERERERDWDQEVADDRSIKTLGFCGESIRV